MVLLNISRQGNDTFQTNSGEYNDRLEGRQGGQLRGFCKVQARDDEGLNLGSGEGERRLVTNGM